MFASSKKTLYLCGEFQKCVDSAPEMQFKNYVSIIIFENAWVVCSFFIGEIWRICKKC